MRHQVGRCRVGGAGAGRRLWRPGGGERKGQLCEQGSRKGAQFLLRLAASKALPGRRRGQTQGVTWEEGRQEEGKDRTGDGPADSAHPVLTAEGVPARRGWVGTGPGPVQTLLQPPFGLPELVLVQRSGRQGLPGPQSESALPSPGGGKAVRREGWAPEDALPALTSGSRPQGPPPTFHRCSIHSAHSSRRRSPRRRNRSPRPLARCPGAPSRTLRFHLQAQTGGQRLSAPPWGGLAPRPHCLAWPGPLASRPAPGMGRGRAPGRALPRACTQHWLPDPPLLCGLPPSLQDDDLTRPGNAQKPLPPAHPLAPRWPDPHRLLLPSPLLQARVHPSPNPRSPPPVICLLLPLGFSSGRGGTPTPPTCPSVHWSLRPRLTHTWEWPWPPACLTPGQLAGVSRAGSARCPHSLRA